MQEARCGTRSWVSRITPWAAGGAKPLCHQGCPPRLISSCLMAMIDFRHDLPYTPKEKPGFSKNKTIEKWSLVEMLCHCRRGMRRDNYRSLEKAALRQIIPNHSNELITSDVLMDSVPIVVSAQLWLSPFPTQAVNESMIMLYVLRL